MRVHHRLSHVASECLPKERRTGALTALSDDAAQKPPGGGIRLTPDALDELDAMLAKGNPVTLE